MRTMEAKMAGRHCRTAVVAALSVGALAGVVSALSSESSGAGHQGGAAVSLHLYAKPIRSCRTFCPETGRADLRRLSYHTVEGEPVMGSA